MEIDVSSLFVTRSFGGSSELPLTGMGVSPPSDVVVILRDGMDSEFAFGFELSVLHNVFFDFDVSGRWTGRNQERKANNGPA